MFTVLVALATFFGGVVFAFSMMAYTLMARRSTAR